jgi:hypothetical protein
MYVSRYGFRMPYGWTVLATPARSACSTDTRAESCRSGGKVREHRAPDAPEHAGHDLLIAFVRQLP